MATTPTRASQEQHGPTRPDGPNPMRADARRNRERLLAAARDAFAEFGADAPLEDIARKAGVGIGTLYRHFPSRLDLQEAVFRDQVTAVCAGAAELRQSHTPGDALAAWLKRLITYMGTKRGLSAALINAFGRDSELVTSCSAQMRVAGSELLTDAQQAGVVRTDIDISDLLRLVHAIVVATEHPPSSTAQRERLLALVFDGLRTTGPMGTGDTAAPRDTP
jgi:AcrR family transcriptional regulator